MLTPILELRDVVVGYRTRLGQKTLQRVSQRLMPGEMTCLLGPNGAGKSTLLRTMSGLQPQLSGEIFLKAKSISSYSLAELARLISIVLTERIEVELFSVDDIVALGRYPYTNWHGTLQREDREIITQTLEAVGALHLRSRNIHELSDGERQRVMIARALTQQPALMLLDEPTAFLDLPHKIDIFAMLRRLTRRTGMSILLATHDLDLALQTSDNIWLFSHGGLLLSGAPEDMILSGEIEREFQREHPNITFDPEHGSFVMPKNFNACVTLHGQGLWAYWTRKALERSGFSISHLPSGIEIVVNNTEEPHYWLLRTQYATSRHASIYELLAALRNRT